MKKALIGIGMLLFGLVAGGIFVILTKKPNMRPAPLEKVELTPERLARGEYLVNHVTNCFDCHAERDWTKFGAPVVAGTEGGGLKDCLGPEYGFPGRVCLPNITPDKETGIGEWTDGELIRAIREGVSRDGTALFPMMPYGDYKNLSDEDVRAIVAYLRKLPPIKAKRERTAIDFPVSFFMKMAPAPVESVRPVDAKDTTAYGVYLTKIGGCESCHTPVDDKHNPILDMKFAGGSEHKIPNGKGKIIPVRSKNLTPHLTGLGATTREQFIAKFRDIRPVSTATSARDAGDRPTIMPWIAASGMTTEDLTAIYDHLQTVPPKDHRVEPWM